MGGDTVDGADELVEEDGEEEGPGVGRGTDAAVAGVVGADSSVIVNGRCAVRGQ
jgi:hypothetical protein